MVSKAGRIVISLMMVMVVIFFSSGSGIAQLADSPWPMRGHDVRHTGQSQYRGPDTPLLRWKFKTGGEVDSSPCIGSDGTVYVGSDDNNLYAINPDGTLRWKFKTGYRVLSSPCIGSDGTVYVGSGDGYLYAINPDGALRWKFWTGSFVDSSPCIGSDGTVYVGSYDDYLYAVNPDGALRWKFPIYDPVFSSPCIDSDWTVYVGSYKYLYAISPYGPLRWEFQIGNGFNSSPCIGSDGTVYVGSNDGYVYALGKATGPVISLSQTELGFSLVQVGISKQMSLTITNTGDVPLLVIRISSSSPEFTISPTSFELDAVSNQEVIVTFTPASYGSKTARLIIDSNDPGRPQITISLAGLAVEYIRILPLSRIITPGHAGHNDTLEVLFLADAGVNSHFAIYDLGGFPVYIADEDSHEILPDGLLRYTWNGRAYNQPDGELAEDGIYIYLLVVDVKVSKGTFAIAR